MKICTRPEEIFIKIAKIPMHPNSDNCFRMNSECKEHMTGKLKVDEKET